MAHIGAGPRTDSRIAAPSSLSSSRWSSLQPRLGASRSTMVTAPMVFTAAGIGMFFILSGVPAWKGDRDASLRLGVREGYRKVDLIGIFENINASAFPFLHPLSVWRKAARRGSGIATAPAVHRTYAREPDPLTRCTQHFTPSARARRPSVATALHPSGIGRRCPRPRSRCRCGGDAGAAS